MYSKLAGRSYLVRLCQLNNQYFLSLLEYLELYVLYLFPLELPSHTSNPWSANIKAIANSGSLEIQLSDESSRPCYRSITFLL